VGPGPNAANDPIDPRGDRLAQATVGVILLAGFVFRKPWVVPLVGVVVGVGAAIGPSANPFHRAYAAWLAPRLARSEGGVSAPTVRAQDAFAAALLGVATLAFLIGLAPVGWLLAVAEAIVAIIAATTFVHLGARLRRLR
jgi:thiosulfate/3-mercaptopyruvate sulfurtransferase